MKLNLIAALLALLVVVIVLVEIFMGDQSWYNYLGVIFFAVVFIMEMRIVLQKD
jgi:hypothetical protein